ncbi:hypothetical protein CPB86DRAFT_773635 [Serendipita vermifera]|nr:hypothetical protein CPB86DRAFT_773635 [Serendipita vermifera]
MRIFSILTVLAAAAGVYAQNATVIIEDLQAITGLANHYNKRASEINVVNILFKGPEVAQGNNHIANSITQIVQRLPNPPPVFKDADAKNIIDYLKTFVTVHQTLLNTQIGKHGLVMFFFTEPVRVSLTLGISLIEMVPTQNTTVQQRFGALSVTINAAIQTYTSSLTEKQASGAQWIRSLMRLLV